MPSCIRHSSWIAAAALALISTVSTFGQTPPEVLSVVPIAAAGRVAPPPGTFAFAFQDQAGHADINAVSIDIAPGLNSLSSMGACFLYFRPSDNQLYLADDGGVWMPPRTLGTAGILQNSQCAIDTGLSTVAPAAPSVSPTATTLTLHLALTFKAALVGANTVNLLAYGPISDSGWQDMGTWTVGPDHLPSAVSVSPTNPPGASQTFTFVYADSDTPYDISAVSVDFASSLTSVGACYLYFRLSDQQLYLADDAGAWMAPVTPGSAGTLQNHQCAVAAAGSSFSVSAAAGTLTVNLALSFTASFAGSKQVWLKPDETTGGAAWAQIGTVTIPPPGTVSTPAFNPPAGTYTSVQTITLASATVGASIRYTTDGSVPTSTSGSIYVAPFGLSATATVRALAYKMEWNDSAVSTATYTISSPVQTITTLPTGLSLTIDGASCTSPCTFQWTAGTSHTLTATAVHPGSTGTRYAFVSWSQGGSASQVLTAPASASTYTANNKTQYYLTSNTAAGGAISPVSDWYDSDVTVSLSATAASGYWFSGFSGDLSGSLSPQSIAMSAPRTVTAGFGPIATVASIPSGQSISVDGAPCRAPCTFQWTAGSSHTLDAPHTIPIASGSQYAFASWSQGGFLWQAITAEVPATYTATYITQYFLTTAATSGGDITPLSGWFNANASVSINAVALDAFGFTGFSGDLTGIANPAAVTMSSPKAVTANFSPADFTVSVTPISSVLLPGDPIEAAKYIVTITPVNRFNGTVAFSVSGLPPGASADFSPPTVSGGGSTTLAISGVLPLATAGNYQLTITASGGALARSVVATVNVQDFTLSMTPVSQSVTCGGTATFQITATRISGFSRQITLALLIPSFGGSLLPPVLTMSAGTAVLTLNVPPSPTCNVGEIHVQVRGIAGTYQQLTRYATANLGISTGLPTEFGISINPNSATIMAPASAGFPVTVIPFNGFNTAVNFTVSTPPAGISASFSPSTVPGPGATVLTLSATSSVPAGTYYITINATSGDLHHSATIALIVGQPLPPITSLTVSPSSIESGVSATVQVSLGSPAPAGGAVVTLTSSDTNAFPAATITIPAGQLTGSTQVLAGYVTTETNATVSITYDVKVSVSIRPARILTELQRFRDCISGSGPALGYGRICHLGPNTNQSDPSYPAYSVDNTLVIGRSNITITGVTVAGPSDVTLRRARQDLRSIMQAESASITSVKITDLTFDGNRYGFGLQGVGISCQNSPVSAFSDDHDDQVSKRRGANQFDMIDLDLGYDRVFMQGEGIFTLQFLEFINAPYTAAWLSGNGTHLPGDPDQGDPAQLGVQPPQTSTISTSSFGQGGYGIGPENSGTAYAERGPETATRFTAIKLAGNYSGAYFNVIGNAGTAGITLTGTNQTVYGNLLLGNRYEISDGSGGGQIVLDADFNGAVTASNAVVAGNVVDGARTFNGNEVEWPAEAVYQKDGQGQYSFRFETDCLIVAPDGCFDGSSSAGCITRQLNSGLEVNGIGHSFYNNESSRHSGSGMQIGCSHPTRQIKISSANPWYVPDSVRFVEGNQAGGIVILGPIYTPKCQTTAGILLDDILVRNNAIAGVFVDSTQGDNLTDSRTGLPYQGFFNDACMSGNKDTLGRSDVTGAPAGDVVIIHAPAAPRYDLSNPLPPRAILSFDDSTSGPSSHSSYQAQNSSTSYRGAACPATEWIAPSTPPPSYVWRRP